jgi:hypothetical protein
MSFLTNFFLYFDIHSLVQTIIIIGIQSLFNFVDWTEISHPLSRRKGESDRKKVELIYLSKYCRVMKVKIAIFAVA